MTSQRQVILDELRSAKDHPTADEIYVRVRRRLPRISLGTVYRNLENLAAEGIIQKLEMAGSQRRFDENPDKHYHIRCLGCGLLRDITISTKFPLVDLIDDTGGFEISGAKLEFLGLCPACSEKVASLPEGSEGCIET